MRFAWPITTITDWEMSAYCNQFTIAQPAQNDNNRLGNERLLQQVLRVAGINVGQ